MLLSDPTPVPNRPQEFREFLRQELLGRIRKNPRYSLRRFAQKLEMDPSALSKMLAGKRPLGPKLVARLGQRLGLSPEAVDSFLVYERSLRQGQNREDSYRQITEDALAVISDWHYYAILELIRVKGFQSRVSWVANALGRSVFEVRDAVERMKRLGMLGENAKGEWVDLSPAQSTTLEKSEATTASLRRLQHLLLAKAAGSLERVDISRRDNTSVTMAIDSTRIAEAKRMITQFRRDLSRFLSHGGTPDQVYNLSVALFPLTKDSSKGVSP